MLFRSSEADINLILRLPRLQSKIQENQMTGRTIRLCEEDLQNILQWYPGVDKSMAYQLAPQGQQDLLELGGRLRARFPELFENQNEENFEFKYDSSDRCKDSAHWLSKGMFGEFPPSSKNGLDGLLDFYNRCPAYLGKIATDFITGDFNKFKKGTEYAELIRRVSIRLGFYHNLDIDDIDAMYNACSFERARNWAGSKQSPWCAVFRAEDFQVLEYWYDMKEYYRTGYGHQIHEKLGCVPIKDLVKAFSERVEKNSELPPSGTFLLSHDTLLNQVVAFLGLYHDQDKLRETGFHTMKDRKWRVTKFSPFASNLGAVLYRCSSGERHRVQLFLNENLLPLDTWGCDADSCSWRQFMSKFGHVLTNCKQRRLCWGI